jgi:glycosyltransferase involved in cell wall biosynthesis
VFFSGKIETEHGVDTLMQAISMLESNPRPDGVVVHFDICGGGSKLDWVKSMIADVRVNRVAIHGFVSDLKYAELLCGSDMCLVLQKANGRHSSFKTPSKGYEYMAYGKAVAVTDVGDFASLPVDTRVLLQRGSAAELAELIRSIDSSTIRRLGDAALSYARSNWGLERNGRRILELFQID